MRAMAAETKGATDDLASLVADFVKKTFCWRVQSALRQRTSIMAVAEKVKAKMPDTVVVGESTATQLSEQRPGTTGNSDNRRTTENSSAVTKREPRQTRQSGHGCVDILDFVTRRTRGAGGITPFRAAYDREYTQETVPLAEAILFKTKHIVETKSGAIMNRIGRVRPRESDTRETAPVRRRLRRKTAPITTAYPIQQTEDDVAIENRKRDAFVARRTQPIKKGSRELRVIPPEWRDNFAQSDFA